MPIVAIFTCVFAGYLVKPRTIIDEVESSGVQFRSRKLYVVVIKYIAPVLLALILLGSILDVMGIITL